MVRPGSDFGDLPAPVEGFLADAKDALRDRKIERLRLYPLLLRTSVQSLIARRQRLYDAVIFEAVRYGYDVKFERKLKRSKANLEGRISKGVFSILVVSPQIAIVASTLAGDDNVNGPRRFTAKSYPLARRPFFPSTALVRLIDKFAADRRCTPTCLDATGYHRQSRRPRREFERQSPTDAAREMAEQGRQIHRMLVGFRYEGRETTRLYFDRNASITLLKGSPQAAVKDLMLPAMHETLVADKTYEVVRTPEPIDQESVELDFQEEPFDSYEAMRTLCDAIRQGDGLNVAIIHLNPYLQAQVLDFFTGEAVEMLVTDARSVSLIPRSVNCGETIERIATTIFRYFGEAKPKRARLDAAI
jgi:hypothetical protein